MSSVSTHITQTSIACPLRSRCSAHASGHSWTLVCVTYTEKGALTSTLQMKTLSLRKLKSCAPGCLRLKLKSQVSLAPKTRLSPCSCPVPFTRLMAASSFLTASCSPTPLPIVFRWPQSLSCYPRDPYMPFTGSSQRPPASPGEADTSPSSLSPGGSWGVLFLSLFLDCTYLGLKRFYFSVPLPQLVRPGTQQDSNNVNQVNERMQDCSSGPITFP